MRRITLSICFVVSLICLLIGTVFAHPGRTDSNGGHTDHSTGEYHYHHGYSAHDHYDMNGDGVVDCPYDFDDKTNHDSGDYGYTSPTEEVKKETKEEKQEVKEETSQPKIGIMDVLELLLLTVTIWLFSSYFLSYFFMLLFGKDQGCSIAMIAGVIVTIIASTWLIIQKL